MPRRRSHNPAEALMAAPVVQILKSADYAQQIRRGAALLGEGKIVVLPTETIYGATALLRRPAACQRLKALRGGGAAGRPLTPHLARREQADQFLGAPGELGRRMMRKLWPGPVGLQFDVEAGRRQEVARSLSVQETDLYNGPWITLRCPDHPVFSDVAGAAEEPVAAVRAGEVGGFDAAVMAEELDGKVDVILDAGPPRFSKPSTLIKVSSGDYQIVRAGVYDERTIRRLMRTTILFVCSGNTCRSPMSEAIARKLLSERAGGGPEALEKRGIEVLSAGSMAMAGAKATPQAAEAVKALGADLSRHRSRPLTIELINQADVIFAMTEEHSRAVTRMVPSAGAKVQRLDPKQDIEDPIGGDAALYNGLAAELWKLIEARLSENPVL
jgi:protein arginine phosphatase